MLLFKIWTLNWLSKQLREIETRILGEIGILSSDGFFGGKETLFQRAFTQPILQLLAKIIKRNAEGEQNKKGPLTFRPNEWKLSVKIFSREKSKERSGFLLNSAMRRNRAPRRCPNSIDQTPLSTPFHPAYFSLSHLIEPKFPSAEIKFRMWNFFVMSRAARSHASACVAPFKVVMQCWS